MNHYGLKNKMNRKFYTGETGLHILDDTIKKHLNMDIWDIFNV